MFSCWKTYLIVMLFVWKKAFGVPIPTTSAATTSAHSSKDAVGRVSDDADVEHDISTNRNKGRRLRLTSDELKDTIYKEIKDTAKKALSCEYGQFYNLEMKTCGDCETRCDSKLDVKRCGGECTVYFRNAMLKHENNVLKAMVGLGFIITVVCGVVICFLMRRSSVNETQLNDIAKRVKGIEERSYEAPSGDQQNKALEEASKRPLIAQAQEE